MILNRLRLASDRAENSIMQTISIAVSAILIAAGLITAPALINNARDTNTRSDLANIGTAQGAYLSTSGSYAPDVASLSSGTGLKLRLSAGSTPGIVTGSDCYAAFAQSASGSYFYRTSVSSAVDKLSPWPTVAPTGYPSNCSWPVAPFSSSGAAYVNPITNANFETPSGVVTTRTNLATNPSFEASTAGTGFVNSGTGSSLATSGTQAFIGAQSLLATWGDSAAEDSGPAFGSTSVTSGTSYTFSAYIRTDNYLASGGLGMSAYGGGVPGGTIRGATTTTIGSWVRVSVSFVASATSTVTAFIGKAAPVSAAGMQANVDAVLIEESSVVGTYFDGSTPAGGDFTYAWAGITGNSVSMQQGVSVASISAYGGAVVQSTDWATSGTHSMRIIPTATTNAAFAYVFIPTIAGKTYTVQAAVRLTAAQTGHLDGRARAIMARSTGVPDTLSPIAPNAAGVTSISFTFVSNASTATLYLFNGASAGNGDVWWDNVVVTAN